MARINIEDSILTDQRFLDLAIKLGSSQYALGVLVWAWRQAQKHFLSTDNDRCIPFDDWKKQKCDDSLIAVGLAEKRERGIWLSGAETQFSWLLQRQNAGEKSGKARSHSSNHENERPLNSVNDSEPLSSYLLSLSSNLKLSPHSSVLSTLVDKVFEIFPRQIGLKGGKEIFLTELKTYGDCHDLIVAVNNYRDFVSDPDNEVQNIFGFKGFAEQWRKWLPRHSKVQGVS